jgi:hypothetical protein
LTGSEDKRKSGGQPGNTNALKHGFYADKAGEKLLEGIYAASGMEGLDADIEYVRAKLRQLEELEPTNFKLIFEGQRTLSLMVCRRRMVAKNGLDAIGEISKKVFNGIIAVGGFKDAIEAFGVVKE